MNNYFSNIVLLIVLLLNSIKTNGYKFENLANCGKSTYNANGFIVDGPDSAGSGQFPWQISLQRTGNGGWFHTCGGTIIDQNWILTAAHCVYAQNLVKTSSMRAVVGTQFLDKGVITYEVQEIIRHDSYNPRTLVNDLALVRVKTPIDFDNSNGLVNSVCLPPEGQKFTQYVTQSGWGTTASNGLTPSNELKFANEVPIVSLPKCRSIYGFNAIREGMLCAGVPESNKAFCRGDGGGPLIQVDPTGSAVLVGIASFNKNCGIDDGIPDVFVEISYFRDWIDSIATNTTNN